MEGIQTFKGSWPWPWIRPYGIPSCITYRPLPIYQISLKSKKLFVDGRTDGHFPPSNIIRSTFGSWPKKQNHHSFINPNSNPFPLPIPSLNTEPKINRLGQSVVDCYHAKFQVIPISDFLLSCWQHPHTNPHTHHDKVIIVLASPYYIVSTDRRDRAGLTISSQETERVVSFNPQPTSCPGCNTHRGLFL